MPKQSTDFLIQLVHSLSKGEKRFFRLYVNRTNPNDDKLFMQLFDVIDKMKQYDEKKVLEKIPKIKKSQISNLKAHLYKQLLISLRQQQRNSRIDIELRENLDYAKILYEKGLYKSSLQILDRAKKIAFDKKLYSDALPIIEFEKHIESQYVTGSMYPKAQQITKETELLLSNLNLRNRLSNLSISLYGLYLQYGFVKEERDHHFITNYFQTHLPDVVVEKLDFYEKMYLYQSYIWYHHMSQDFLNFYKYAQKWADLFTEYPEMVKQETSLYLKSLHNLLTACFIAQRLDKFDPVFETYIKIADCEKALVSQNEFSNYFLYKYIHSINKVFLTAQYEENTEFLHELEAALKTNDNNWDLHRMLNFYYKIGCIYFGKGDLNNTITNLNKVTNQVYPNFREDIQCYARILNLISHFDLGNEVLVSYQIKSTYRFILKLKHDDKVIKEIFSFLRKTPSMLESELKAEFIKLRNKLSKLEDDPYERRPFLFLDIISWLDSKIHGVTMAESIRARKT